MVLESTNFLEAEQANSCIKTKHGGKLIGIFTRFLLAELFCPKHLLRINLTCSVVMFNFSSTDK